MGRVLGAGGKEKVENLQKVKMHFPHLGDWTVVSVQPFQLTD